MSSVEWVSGTLAVDTSATAVTGLLTASTTSSSSEFTSATEQPSTSTSTVWATPSTSSTSTSSSAASTASSVNEPFSLERVFQPDSQYFAAAIVVVLVTSVVVAFLLIFLAKKIAHARTASRRRRRQAEGDDFFCGSSGEKSGMYDRDAEALGEGAVDVKPRESWSSYADSEKYSSEGHESFEDRTVDAPPALRPRAPPRAAVRVPSADWQQQQQHVPSLQYRPKPQQTYQHTRQQSYAPPQQQQQRREQQPRQPSIQRHAPRVRPLMLPARQQEDHHLQRQIPWSPAVPVDHFQQQRTDEWQRQSVFNDRRALLLNDDQGDDGDEYSRTARGYKRRTLMRERSRVY